MRLNTLIIDKKKKRKIRTCLPLWAPPKAAAVAVMRRKSNLMWMEILRKSSRSLLLLEVK
jgi:hypothetical protein